MPLLLLLLLVLLLLLLQTTLLLCKFLLLFHGLELLLKLRNKQALHQHEDSTLIKHIFKMTATFVNLCGFYFAMDNSVLYCKNKIHAGQ